jgi:hypothetical protein
MLVTPQNTCCPCVEQRVIGEKTDKLAGDKGVDIFKEAAKIISEYNLQYKRLICDNRW